MKRFTRTESSTTSTFLIDALGSTVALTDSFAAVQTSYSYDPYGVTSTSGSASDNPFQFTGRQNDGTGVYYYRARYYNPTWGRFVSQDPIGFGGGINLYAYARSTPTLNIDPNGLAALGPYSPIPIPGGAGQCSFISPSCEHAFQRCVQVAPAASVKCYESWKLCDQGFATIFPGGGGALGGR
jgi:RHS repeat-associated protein